jgi:glutathione S-transferase
MTDIIIYGIVQSSYVRTVRLACEEKGVSYEVQPIEFGSPEHLALHPFGKVPSARHGDVTMYETSAIVRYIDAAFDGPALLPADLLARTRMEQWISATIDYFYQDMIRELVFPRLVAPSRGAEPDEEMIAGAVPKIDGHLGILEATLADSDYLAGDGLSLADLFYAPVHFWLGITPEGQGLLPKYPAVGRWWERMTARPSVVGTVPPPPSEERAA